MSLIGALDRALSELRAEVEMLTLRRQSTRELVPTGLRMYHKPADPIP